MCEASIREIIKFAKEKSYWNKPKGENICLITLCRYEMSLGKMAKTNPVKLLKF